MRNDHLINHPWLIGGFAIAVVIMLLLDLGVLAQGERSSFDQLFGRIIIPLHNPEGETIGFTGRIYRNEDIAKYVNTRETVIFKKGDTLYNYFLAPALFFFSFSIII